MEFVNKTFYTDKVSELNSFGSFLGNLQYLSLDAELKDKKGNILVQPKRPLTAQIVKALSSREDDNEFKFYLDNSKSFNEALVARIVKEINQHISLADFSYASFLLDKQRINTSRVATLALGNDFFKGFITMLLYEHKPIANHLFEVALTSVGLMANLKPNTFSNGELAKIFIAGILHDYSISQTVMWEEKDIFSSENPNQHDVESASQVSNQKIDEDIPEIIKYNNHLRNNYQGVAKGGSWFNDPVELMSVIINIVEYYTYVRRDVMKRGGVEDPMSVVMYEISLEAEKGFFPKPLIGLFEGYFSKYAEFFKYGEGIGAVENKCPHGPYALAYPKPKSTQVLCKNSEVPCPHRYSGKQLNVVRSENDMTGRYGEHLYPGWYDKCDFSEQLPAPPKNF